MVKSYLRGNEIEFINDRWIYCDTKEPTTADLYNERSCGHCGLSQTPEGHDGCLGTLPGAMNACCGHGQTNEAYVQLGGGFCLRGKEAIEVMSILKNHREEIKSIESNRLCSNND